MMEKTLYNSSSRSVYLDWVKGVAIILMVLGHCMQYGSKYRADELYFENGLFMWIYSFHMPLFMLVSGYLFRKSMLHRTFLSNIKHRAIALLLPVFTWNSLWLVHINSSLLISGEVNFRLSEQLQSYFSALWFLWALFWCSIIVLFVHRFLRDSIGIYICLGILLLFVPGKYEGYFLVKNQALLIFMYPYFIAGYMWSKFKLYHFLVKNSPSSLYWALLFSLLLFMFLFIFYNKDTYIYNTGTCILNGTSIDFMQLLIDIYRYLIGFVGATVMFLLLRLLIRKLGVEKLRVLAIIGVNSIGIYIISSYVELYLPLMPHVLSFGYIGVLAETCIIVGIICYITVLLRKNHFLNRVLFGGR